MSSPILRRSQRDSHSATPTRVAQSQALASSPSMGAGAGPQLLSEAAEASQAAQGPLFDTTPKRSQSNVTRLTSSPLFYRSSPMPSAVSSNATPRASRAALGDSSPIRYADTSSPHRSSSRRPDRNLRSSSNALFLGSDRTENGRPRARQRRGDIMSDVDQTRRRLVGEPTGSSVATLSNLDPTTSEANALSGGNSGRLIWGSTVSQAEAHHSIRDFLYNFESRYRMIRDGSLAGHDHLPADHPGKRKEYIEMMNTMLDLGVSTLNVDMKNVRAYPATIKLWHQLQSYPSEIIHIFDTVIKEIMLDLAEKKVNNFRSQTQRNQGHIPGFRHPSSIPPTPSSEVEELPGSEAVNVDADLPDLVQEVESTIYKVRPFGLDKTVNLRDLNPEDMDKVVSVKGLVIRTTSIIPDMKEAFFQCSVCSHTVLAEINRGQISEPSRCPREACNATNSMQIVHNRSRFADKQVIKLQETPDSVPDGQTPHSVSLCAFDELVDFCKAGDRVEVTGIFKCNQVRVNPRQRTVKNVFKTYLDVLHIQKVDKKRMGIDTTTIEQELSEQVSAGTQEARKVTEEEEQKFKETASRADVYELLSRSLAPSVYEMDDVKKGILLQLFGGTNKSFEKGGNPKYRGDINVLLCGDPSTSKSQLLQYVHKIAPRGVYTSGKGSSAVGLTAYVTRDSETRQLVLESGALVLSDGGVCCIDEFDKMSDSTRSVLHEVMEQQTVSIAKAGIITTLNARTSILASANPIGSKYNPNLPVPQNIDLPPTLLSRFDLLFLVLDQIEEQSDRRLARHLVGMYLEDAPENASAHEILPVDFLTAYISYARTNCHPKLSQAASEELVRAYVEMRKLGEDVRAAERRITATTRQLESMIRLSEAHAKMRLSHEVNSNDVLEAVRLIKSAIKQAATDSRTGLIDMGLLTEGSSASERRRKQDLKNAITDLLDEMTRQGGLVRYTEFAKHLGEQSSIAIEADQLADAMRSLQQEGQLQISGEGGRRSIRRVAGIA